MKLSNKAVWILSSVLMVLGVMFLGIGISLGGKPYFSIGTNGIKTANDQYKETINYKLEKTRIEPFENIDLLAHYSDITIKASDGYYLEYSLTDDKEAPFYEVKYKTLTFREAIKNNNVNFDVTFFTLIGPNSREIQNDSITLYVPEDVYLKKVKLKSNDGKITWLDNAKIDILDINNSYGQIQLSNLQLKSVRLQSNDTGIKINNCKSNDIDIVNSYGNVEVEELITAKFSLDMNDGVIKLSDFKADTFDLKNKYGNTSGKNVSGQTWKINHSDGKLMLMDADINKINITQEYGDVELSLKGKEDSYNYNLKSEYGKVKLNDESKDKKYINDNGSKNEIIINNKDGKIQINTEEKE